MSEQPLSERMRSFTNADVWADEVEQLEASEKTLKQINDTQRMEDTRCPQCGCYLRHVKWLKDMGADICEENQALLRVARAVRVCIEKRDFSPFNEPRGELEEALKEVEHLIKEPADE